MVLMFCGDWVIKNKGRSQTCWVPGAGVHGVQTDRGFFLKVSQSPDGGVEQRQSGESVCLKLLILHLQKTVYISQGHPEPGPPCNA